MARGLLVTCALAFVAGCGLYGRDDPGHWPGEDLAACDTERRAYRIDELHLPEDGDEAEALGWDLDRDGTIDNQGGNIASAVAQALDVDLNGRVAEALVSDEVLVAITLDQCADPPYTLVSLHRGLDIDRTLDPPRLLALPVTEYAMVASQAVPAAAADGWSRFPVGSLIHGEVTEWIEAPRVVAVIDEVDDFVIAGRLAAALDGDQAFDTVTVGFHAIVRDRIAELGGCTPAQCDPLLDTLLGVFDEDEDGTVTLEEVQDNSLVRTLLRPDVEGGPSWSAPDDEARLLSIGVAFRATRVDLFLGE